MKKLFFDYHMQISYSEPVTCCHYTIKCLPKDTDRQRVEELHMELLPQSRYCQGEDTWGNGMIFGSVEDVHTSFAYRISGVVTTGLAESEPLGKESLLGLYRYLGSTGSGHLAVAGEGLQAYGRKLQQICKAEQPIALAKEMMHRLHEDYAYMPRVTDVGTNAEEAWQLGQGVCQDYAHILIVLCRLAGIPARYVAGLMMGEGASHAWVEVLDSQRWYGLDPTNDMVVNEDYIRLGSGRDASNCALNRGLVTGGGCQRQTVSVLVNG